MAKLVMEKEHMEKLYSSGNPFIKYINNRRLNEICKLLPGNKEIKILDAGCGEGQLLERISKMKYKNLYGVDVTKVALEDAKKRVKAKLFLQNLNKMSFPDKFFDAVICTEVIEHIPDYKKVLNEFKRILKKNGLLIISFPNEPLCVLMRMAFLRNPRIKDHVNSFSVRRMKKEVGLKFLRKVNLPLNLPDFLSLIHILEFKN